MSKENIIIDSMYGVNDEIKSCPRCDYDNLRADVAKTMVSDIGIAKNWYCSKCKSLWILGIRNPQFKKQ